MPYGQLGYLHTSRGDVTETGAGTLDIAYGSHDGSIFSVTGGLRGGYNGHIGTVAMQPWLDLGGTGFTGNTRFNTGETIGSLTTAESSNAAPRAFLNTGAGVTFNEGKTWSGTLSYAGQVAKASQLNTFAATVTYKW